MPERVIEAPPDKIARWRELEAEVRRLEFASVDPLGDWHRTARAEQRLPEEDYRVFLLIGGRGSGKHEPGRRASLS